MTPAVASFFEPGTCSVGHVVFDADSRRGVVIDAMLEHDACAGVIGTATVERMLAFVRCRRLHVDWLLETHVHADHLSAAWWLKERLGAPVGIGAGTIALRKQLVPSSLEEHNRYDRYFVDGEFVAVGGAIMRVWSTPGHTPTCVSYVFDGHIFVGDTLFTPDYGTARADFPGGDARALYRSIQRLLALSPNTRVYAGHDYLTITRTKHRWISTVREQRAHNVHVRDGVTECEFVRARVARDRTLSPPALMGSAVPFNLGVRAAASTPIA